MESKSKTLYHKLLFIKTVFVFPLKQLFKKNSKPKDNLI